jgi:hypothetical protein
LLNTRLHHAADVGCEGIGRARLVIDTTLERAISADQRIEGLAHIKINRARCGQRRLDESSGQEQQQLLVIAQKVLGDADVLVGKLMRIGGRDLLVPVRFAQVRAIQRAIHRDFALGAAAHGTNVAANAWTEPLGAANMANCAGHFFSIEDRGHGGRHESIHQGRNRARRRGKPAAARSGNLPADHEGLWRALG